MALWLAETSLVLASRSAIRRTLLEAAGIPVDIHPADVDERALEAAVASEPPGAVAALLAREKALAVGKLYTGGLVLGADQVLALGIERFTKPANRDAVRAQLQALRGRTHELHSAIAFAQDAEIVFEHVGVARLTMRAFSDGCLEDYLKAMGETASSSVGGYQLEGLGIQLFEKIDGDYFTVLGLPMMQALAFLRQSGRLAP